MRLRPACANIPGIPVPAESLRPPLWVSEIVYVPLLTELVVTARKHGCRTLDGGGMAVFQGAMAFKLFFEVEPDIHAHAAPFPFQTGDSGGVSIPCAFSCSTEST